MNTKKILKEYQMAIVNRPTGKPINDFVRGALDGAAVPANIVADQSINRVMLNKTFWIVRAGEREFRFDDFKSRLTRDFPDWSPSKMGNSAGQLYRKQKDVSSSPRCIHWVLRSTSR